MDAAIFTKDEVKARFAAGQHCAQCTLLPWAEELGYDAEELQRMAAAFGGGMFRGDTCGAVTGALIALGLVFGDDNAVMEQKTAQFQAAFRERFGSTLCREILGYDLSQPGALDAARASGNMTERCPAFVRGASEILQDMLKDE